MFSGPRLLRSALAHAALCITCAASACAPSPDATVETHTAPIIAGSATTDYPGVVLVVRTNSSGSAIISLCSGSVIGSRRVLTAKHCVYTEAGAAVAANRLRVLVGSNIDSPSDVIGVQSWASAGTGAYTDEDGSQGRDVAVLATSTDIGVAAYELARAQPRVGNPLTLVGFGVDDNGDTGVKRVGTSNVGEVITLAMDTAGNTYSNIFSSLGGGHTCSGDSGGPAFDANGRIVGVTSFGLTSDCSDAEGWFTEVAANLDFIEGELDGDAPCTASAETCDGADDDCDGFVDNGCTPLGSSCTDSRECASGSCLGTVSGTCELECDPTSVDPGCPSGTYCEALTCGSGMCTSGEPGTRATGAECSNHTQCATNYCLVRADGSQLCARPCRLDGDACGTGLECITEGLDCGGCLSPDEIEQQPLGTACGNDVECLSELCGDDNYCTTTCSTHAECEGMLCQDGLCVLGTPLGVDEECTDAALCDDALSCVEFDDGFRCRAACDEGCAEGYVCEDDVCRPDEPVLGEACSTNEECLSNICAGVCTQICSDASECPDGFECRPAGVVSGCFPTGDTSSGGCRAGGEPAPTIAVWMLLGLALRTRRRALSPRPR